MSLVTGAEEAEEIAAQWLKKKFVDKLKKTRMTNASLSDAAWNVRVEVELSSGVLSTAHRVIILKIDANSAKVVSYSESDKPSSSSVHM